MLPASIAIVLALILWGLYRGSIYRKAVRYKPTAGSEYLLPEGVPINANAFELETTGTILLELKLRSTLLGRLFDPLVSVRIGDQTIEFYFERGISAPRHLVLPSTPKTRYTLTTRNVKIDSAARFWHYPSDSTDRGPLAVIAPHPDDAEISAFAAYRAEPTNTHILNITQGEKGIAQLVPGLGKEAQQTLTATLRVFDACTIPQMVQVPAHQITDLSWREAEFPLSEARQANLSNEIERFLTTSGAKRIVIPHPLLDSHPAHLDVAQATVAAIRRIGDPAMKVLGVLIHVPGHRRYPIGKLGSGVALPPNAKAIKAFSSVEAFWLSEGDKMLKCFALDANHDLRGLPAPLAGDPDLIKLARYSLRSALTGVASVASSDYYRRSVRACELFLVYEFEDLESVSGLSASS